MMMIDAPPDPLSAETHAWKGAPWVVQDLHIKNSKCSTVCAVHNASKLASYCQIASCKVKLPVASGQSKQRSRPTAYLLEVTLEVVRRQAVKGQYRTVIQSQPCADLCKLPSLHAKAHELSDVIQVTIRSPMSLLSCLPVMLPRLSLLLLQSKAATSMDRGGRPSPDPPELGSRLLG